MATDVSPTTDAPRKKGFRFPSAYTILFFVLLAVWGLTFVIKPGSYEYVSCGGGTPKPVPGSYSEITYGPQHPDVAMVHNSLGIALLKAKRSEEALATFQAGLDAGAPAQRSQRVGLQQQGARALAIVELGKDMEAVHSEVAKDTPSRRSVRSAASTPR